MRLAPGVLRGCGDKHLGQLRPIPILGGVIMTFARLDRMVTRQENFAISIFDFQVSWLGVFGRHENCGDGNALDKMGRREVEWRGDRLLSGFVFCALCSVTCVLSLSPVSCVLAPAPWALRSGRYVLRPAFSALFPPLMVVPENAFFEDGLGGRLR